MFADEMIKGTFKAMHHVHSFEKNGDGTRMIDEFEFTSPLGMLGIIADNLFLKNYMTKFLENKNQELKNVAESEKWKKVLNHTAL